MGVNHWHAREPSDYIPQPYSSSTWPLVSFIYHGSGWVTRGGGLIIKLAWESSVMHDAPTPLLILNNAMGKVNKQPQWEFTQGWGLNQTGGMGINDKPSLPPPPIN